MERLVVKNQRAIGYELSAMQVLWPTRCSFPETVQMRGDGLHQAVHGPQLAAEARQGPHPGGAAPVPASQGPGQPG